MKLQEFPHIYECKPGKVSRWIQGLSANPANESDSTESDSTESDSGSSSPASSCDETPIASPAHIRSLGINAYPLKPTERAAKQTAKEVIRQGGAKSRGVKIPQV